MSVVDRPAAQGDWPSIWAIVQEVAAAGKAFAMDPAPSETGMRDAWLTPPPGRVVVAEDQAGRVLGTANAYANRPNQGSHVASGSVMVAATARGRGVGRMLVRDMIAWTTERGFRSIQFNAVVASNEAAVRLYESEGFRIIGTAPGGFRHPVLGYVDLLSLWRDLP